MMNVRKTTISLLYWKKNADTCVDHELNNQLCAPVMEVMTFCSMASSGRKVGQEGGGSATADAALMKWE